MSFRAFGVEFHFSFWFFVVVLAVALRMGEVFLFYLALPMVLHEGGHLLVMLLCGAQVERVALTPFSVDIRRSRGKALSYGQDVLISLGGVLANLGTALLCYYLAFQSMRMMFFVASNVAVAMFNLLPIGTLDGGRVVSLLAARFSTPQLAWRISKIVSVVALAPLFALAVLLVLRGLANITLLLACLYLAAVVLYREGE